MLKLHRTLATLVLSLPLPAQVLQPPPVADLSKIRFLVAGHAYGAHNGSNRGLHPPLVDKLSAGAFGHLDFVAFTGDVLRRCDEDSWGVLEADLKPLGIPFYLAMGNHDASDFGLAQIQKQFGSLHYSFDIAEARFIFLNTQEVARSISPNQLEFLQDALRDSEGIATFFVFMHELLWLSHKPEYRKIRANSRSRQKKLSKSNYWSAVHPLLVQQAPRKAFVIAGDVAGNEDAIPAFKDVMDNVTLIASGMGEVKEENAMLVTIRANRPVFRLFALDDSPPRNLDDYSPQKLNGLPWDAFRREPPSHWLWRYAWTILATSGLVLAFGFALRRKRSAPQI